MLVVLILGGVVLVGNLGIMVWLVWRVQPHMNALPRFAHDLAQFRAAASEDMEAHAARLDRLDTDYAVRMIHTK